jgi:hypothetical protein
MLSETACIEAGLNSRCRKTLASLFRQPLPRALKWADIEALLLAAGCRVVEGAGSRVRFEKDGHIAIFHRPHPEKEAKRYQVRAARDFLELIGIRP